MRPTRALCGTLLVGLLAAAAAGCGSSAPAGKEVKGAKVGGVLLQNGKPVKFLKEETITVSFAQGEGEGQIAASAEVKPEDGTFTVDGPTNQGIPPGKYTVQVTADAYGAETPDRFAVLFDPDAERPRPPLTVDVGAEEGQRFEIDIGKWTAKKK